MLLIRAILIDVDGRTPNGESGMRYGTAVGTVRASCCRYAHALPYKNRKDKLVFVGTRDGDVL